MVATLLAMASSMQQSKQTNKPIKQMTPQDTLSELISKIESLLQSEGYNIVDKGNASHEVCLDLKVEGNSFRVSVFYFESHR